jgi:prepilin-type N-terminal cleavage/methylation domain-containing protein
MSHTQRGQTLIEVLTTSALLGIILIGSATGYRNYNRGDSEIRASLISAALDSSFSQLSKDTYLMKEMFLDREENAALKSCLTEGSCPTDWMPMGFDKETAWPYAQAQVSFEFRSKKQDIVEIRMRRDSRRPVLIWLARYDYLNLDSKMTQIACSHRYVIGGIDFTRGDAICVSPSSPPSPRLQR